MKLKNLALCWQTMLMLAAVNVSAQPYIASQSASTAHVGASVTFTGLNFSPVAANNVVYFGATRGTVTTAGTNTLVVTVPNGASNAPVSITNTSTGLTGYGQYGFLPSYNNAGALPAINFAPKVDIPLASAPTASVVHDIDGDGKPDIVISGLNDKNLRLYRNIATAGILNSSSLAAPVSFDCSNELRELVVADIDRDGKPDLIGVAQSELRVWRNTSVPGTISLATMVVFPADINAASVAVRDIDLDGRPDIAVGNTFGKSFSIFRNTCTAGSITSTSFAAKFEIATNGIIRKIAFEDIDGDIKPDVLLVQEHPTDPSLSGTLMVYRNQSSQGTLSVYSFSAPVIFTTGTGSCDVATADIDGNGRPDVMVTNVQSGTLSVYRNIASPGFINAGSLAPKVDFPVAPNVIDISIADFDGDAKPDIAVSIVPSFQTKGGVSVFRNVASPGTINTSSFAPKYDILFSGTVMEDPRRVSANDLDGDNKADIFYTVYGADGRMVLIRNSPLAFMTPISVPSPLCKGNSITVTCAPFGGVWTSSNPGIASVGLTTGVVTGNMAGIANITYTIGANYTTTTVTVNPQVQPIVGPGHMCGMDTAQFTCATPGGVWSTDNNFLVWSDPATGKTYTSYAAGSVNIIYTVNSGCFNTKQLIVDPGYMSISGKPTVCVNGTTVLTSYPGGVWTSSHPAIATVNPAAGIVTGISTGTSIITYTTPCAVAYVTVTVTSTPPAITGNFTICSGGETTTLYNEMQGTWSSSNNAVATVGVSSGVVTGVAAGVANITFTSDVCGYTYVTVTVNQAPTPISGANIICVGGTALMTNGTPAGTWSSSPSFIASVDGVTGVATGLFSGQATITYKLNNDCYTTKVLSVDPTPEHIMGGGAVCIGASATFTCPGYPGGVWSTSNSAIATVDPVTGTVTGVSAGNYTLTYTLPPNCYTTRDQIVMPAALGLEATAVQNVVCQGGTSTLTAYPNNTQINTVSSIPYSPLATAGGSILTSDDGTATVALPFTFKLFNVDYNTLYVNANGFVSFGAATSGFNYTAVPMPSANAPVNLTPQAMIALFWHDMGTHLSGTITKGIVGVAPNRRFVISYNSVPDYLGTGTNTGQVILHETSNIIDVMIGNTGNGNVAYNKTCAVQNADGTQGVAVPGQNGVNYTASMKGWRFYGVPTGLTYSWETTSGLTTPTLATTLAKPVIAGTQAYTVTVTSGVCKLTAPVTVTVNPLPNAGTINGATSVIQGNGATLTSTMPGGIWASASPGVVAINSASGLATGISAGSTTISYNVTNTCGTAVATKTIKVFAAKPAPPIAGNEEAEHNIKLYPNPAHNILNIDVPEAGTFLVIAIDGREVGRYNVTAGSTVMQIPANTAPGEYIGYFIGENGLKHSCKLVFLK